MRKRYKVLIIAEAANPSWSSVPLLGWYQTLALAQAADVYLVTHQRNRSSIEAEGWRHGSDFSALDSDPIVRPLYRVASWIRGGPGKGWTAVTAAMSIGYPFFERMVWRRFGKRIGDGCYDVVHRITPVSPTAKSWIAKKVRRAGVPFVLGPLNGGLPWPKGFNNTRIAEKEWLSIIRPIHRFMPSFKGTLRNASAILIGSRATWRQIPEKYKHKSVYLVENGVPAALVQPPRTFRHKSATRACFVGRLVPYKGLDMAIEAAIDLLQTGRLHLYVAGSGPIEEALHDLTVERSVSQAVTFLGWLRHEEVPGLMRSCDVLLFPSIREFGGGVVLEAMAAGVVPVVVDYGGPAELVHSGAGYVVPLGTRAAIIASLEKVLCQICHDRANLRPMSIQSQRIVAQKYTWDKKASQILRLYDWITGRSEKPDWRPPPP